MRKRAAAFAVVLVAVAAMLILGSAVPALAHEERVVGTYHFAVGFGDEPAYTGLKNSVQLILADANDKPVTDLGDTLKVEVIVGDQKLPLAFEPDFEVGEFGTPGDYRAWFFPTQPGDYTFHFTGSIKGQRVDESFTSSPTTFSSVQDPTQVEFPTKEPAAGQIAARLDREVTRLNNSVAAARKSVSDKADTARFIGFISLGVGVVGLVIATAALMTARRTRRGLPAVQGTPASTVTERS
ncbi:MAG TPA: hypothetical protein VGL18_16140 [Actinomycetota bacterium]